jgi:phosphoribosylformylglycinamidine cyclo-ligase
MGKNTYKAAGVDKEAGYKSVELIKKFIKNTYNPYVLGDLGSFAGAVEIPPGYDNPVLVSGTDGVGTKLLVAQFMDKHDTVGQDLVAMCVNDVLCHGAKPIYFLDYIACGKNKPKKIAQIVEGIANGCIIADCPLIGGETAEMPGMYAEDEYDLAGFTSGIVDKKNFITAKNVAGGDVLIGLKASGLHSNGYSLVRKVFFEANNYHVDTYFEELGRTLGEELITPTCIYVRDIMHLLGEVNVKGMCNITGGGYTENIPRMIPDGLCARVRTRTYDNPIYDMLAREGDIDEEEMYATFNMGTGFVIAVAAQDYDKACAMLKPFGHEPFELGVVAEGKEKINLWF